MYFVFLIQQSISFWNIFCASVLLSRYLYSSRLGASPYYFYNCPHKLFQQWSNFHQILVLVTLARNVLLVCVRGRVTLYIFSTIGEVRWIFFLNAWIMHFDPKFSKKMGCFLQNILIIPLFTHYCYFCIIFTRVVVMASFNWTLITVQLLCNWVISSMFSLNKSSLFLTPLRVYLSANPLFCRFRVFSLFDLREGVWLADVYECPPVSQTEIVKLLRLSKMERNDGGSLHASIIHHWTRKILCSSGENGEECFQCLLWSNNDSCDSRWKIDNGSMTPGKWSCHVCID